MIYCRVLVIKFSIIEGDYWGIDNLLENGEAKIHNSNVDRFTEFSLERKLKKI